MAGADRKELQRRHVLSDEMLLCLSKFIFKIISLEFLSFRTVETLKLQQKSAATQELFSTEKISQNNGQGGWYAVHFSTDFV